MKNQSLILLYVLSSPLMLSQALSTVACLNTYYSSCGKHVAVSSVQKNLFHSSGQKILVLIEAFWNFLSRLEPCASQAQCSLAERSHSSVEDAFLKLKTHRSRKKCLFHHFDITTTPSKMFEFSTCKVTATVCYQEHQLECLPIMSFRYPDAMLSFASCIYQIF